jgi:hypothetical protein
MRSLSHNQIGIIGAKNQAWLSTFANQPTISPPPHPTHQNAERP